MTSRCRRCFAARDPGVAHYARPQILLWRSPMKFVVWCSVLASVFAASICSVALEAAAQTPPIIGCVKPGTGLLRIPDPGEGCKAEERPLGFNDLPLIVALRDRVVVLEGLVTTLQQRLVDVEAC